MALQVQKAPCVEKTGSLLESPFPNILELASEFDRILATELQALSDRIQIAHRSQLAILVKDAANCAGMLDGENPLECAQSAKHARPVSDTNSLESRSTRELRSTAKQSEKTSGRKTISIGGQSIFSSQISENLAIGVESMQGHLAALRNSVMSIEPEGTPSRENRVGLIRIILHPIFNHFIACTIFVNTIIIALQTEWRARHVGRDQPLIFIVADMCCNAIFVAECCLKLMVHRLSYFTGKDWKWNVFDTVVVLFALAEVMAILFTEILVIPGATLLRVLRLVRIVRTVRVLRVSKLFKELRTMVNSMLSCVKAFSWLVVLLVFVIFISCVFVTDGVNDEKERIHNRGSQYDEDTRHLDEDFGSLSRSFYSLFKAISNGQSWGVYGDRLLRKSKMAAVLFIGYITFVTLAVLNVVTGIFVNFSMKAAEDDMDHMALEYITKQDKLIKEFCLVFENADVNKNERVSLEEFIAHLSDPGVRAYFKFIDLDIDLYSPEKIFKLLDFDGGNTVDLKEFVTGMSRFRGHARALDVAAVHSDLMRLDKRITALFGALIGQSQDSANWLQPSNSFAR